MKPIKPSIPIRNRQKSKAPRSLRPSSQAAEWDPSAASSRPGPAMVKALVCLEAVLVEIQVHKGVADLTRMRQKVTELLAQAWEASR